MKSREIKFRGKRETDGEWLYGYYFVNRGEHFIVKDELASGNTFLDYEVDSETVGQFSGLKDMNGKEIYAGDIVRGHQDRNYFVKFYSGMFYGSVEECNKGIYGGFPLWSLVDMGCEIVGNKFDNPDPLK